MFKANSINSKGIGSFGFSLIAHGSAALAIAVAPQLQMIPEGTVESQTIEFVAVKAPQGNQTKTRDVGTITESKPKASAKAKVPKNLPDKIVSQEDLAPLPSEDPNMKPVEVVEDSPVEVDQAEEAEDLALLAAQEAQEKQRLAQLDQTKKLDEERQKIALEKIKLAKEAKKLEKAALLQ